MSSIIRLHGQLLFSCIDLLFSYSSGYEVLRALGLLPGNHLYWAAESPSSRLHV